jgi:hypothetical protein
MQKKTPFVAQPLSRPAPPPVYRPQQNAAPMKAPPVYRPASAAPQMKPAVRPAPPVYRPQAPVFQRMRANVIQRAPGNPATGLKEGETAALNANDTVKFTALSAGCMAITVCYTGGGGAALHMAMEMDNATQFNELLGLTNGHTVRDVYLDGDLQGTQQGWYVKSTLDPTDFMPTADLTASPKAFLEFQGAPSWEWSFDSGSVIKWFAAKFGVASNKIHSSTKTTGITHQC